MTRLPSRYGSLDRARAAALLLLALPGPVFLYQGQELGLEEVDLPDEARQDPIFRRTKGARKGRDGCRVPMPWEGAAPPFGFTGGTPWLPIPAAWAEKTVERETRDPSSTLALHRSALALRRQLSGDLQWQESAAGTLLFARGDVVCAVNVDADALALPRGEVLVASRAGLSDQLPRDSAAWVRVG